MAKEKKSFQCTSCGGSSPRWQGKCPSCGEWNTLQEVVSRPVPAGRVAAPSGRGAVSPTVLAEHPSAEKDGMATGIGALDTVLGSGLLPGSAVLLGGEPGIGKSTLLMQLAGSMAASGKSAVYLSGEESLGQLKGRAGRLGLLESGLLALSSTSAEDAMGLLAGGDAPDLLIVDSVQTMATTAVESIPGSVSQVRAVSASLIEAAKKTDTALMLVGHVTKDGQIAGPKLLEHMVDTVLSLEGDRSHLFRILRVLKNRFGPTDELAVFTMEGRGMSVVEDPSTFFLGARDPGLSGAALVMAVDGRRPFAVEVQALAGRSFLSIPRRTALGFDTNRLNLLLAVMEKRLGLNFGLTDIYAKISGGLNLKDPGLDLGVAAAVLSSFTDRALPEGAVFWGEVDLNGQIRPVSGMEVRMKQASRLGYRPIFHPATDKKAGGCRTLSDLQEILFG